MSRPAITVEDLSKLYRIGVEARQLPSFREAMVNTMTAPLRRLRRLGSDGASADDKSDFWALRHVNFEVQPGEVVGIVGRNGAGKSTLLKILSRITEPTEGCIRLRGRVASLLEVGTGFHPELTGRENIYLNGSILGMRRAEIHRKFAEIVEFAEMAKFLDTPVKYYSSGMYVRLAFSVAAHLDPQILIVDEVLAVGDAAFQHKCLGKMGEVTREGRTVLFVSHNMAAVRSLCTSCCLLSGGTVIFRGDASEGVDQYLRATLPAGVRSSAEFKPPGPDRPWMRSATLHSNGVQSGTVAMGEDLVLSVEFASPAPLRYPKLGFNIIDSEGNRLVNANNRYQPSNELDAPCTGGTITCDLGMLPLMPGRYSISLWFGDFAHDSHVAEDAMVFEVVERDAWGLGQTPPSACSSLWWPTRFQIDASPTPAAV